MTVWRLLIALVALLLAVQLVRNTAVQALTLRRPGDAAKIWRDHPAVELQSGLTAIAEATRERKRIARATFGEIFDAARKDPLAPEPFLVRGVRAQSSGDERSAERAFLAAKWRDGRSLPARYFLADLYFRHGDSKRGLPEIAALSRLAPNGIHSLAPYLAAYARDHSTWPQLKALFSKEPELEDAALMALAVDAGNTDTVLALANPSRSGSSSPWLAPLIETLIKDAQYERARQVWAHVSRVRIDLSALLFDPGFTRTDAPPPFNWALSSSTVGLAERLRGGGLHVIFYGREDGALASQLLVLPPGQYRLVTTPVGIQTNAEALQFRLTCQGTTSPFVGIPLSAATAHPWIFTVAPGCRAQHLELFGLSADIPKQSEATIDRVSLVRTPPNV